MPEKGYYYHYKHDPNGEVNNYAYEVQGTALHTENNDRMVVYKPLYKDDYFKGTDYCVRPLDMFIGQVTEDGKTFPRFTKINDSGTIKKLQKHSLHEKIDLNEPDHCPICEEEFTEENRRVKYHVQYRPLPKVIIACQKCNFAEYLLRHNPNLHDTNWLERVNKVRKWRGENLVQP